MKNLGLGLIALVSAYNGGCAGTDTGNPYDGTGESNASETCDEQRRQLTLGEPTSLGVSAQDVTDLVSGEHRETLAWQAPSGVTYGPESGTGEITIVVEPLRGARFVERAPKSQGSEEGGPGLAIDLPENDCPDAIELDVRLHISTAGGALNETVDTTLEATSGELVVGNVRLPTDALAGSFEVEVAVQPGFEQTKAPALTLALAISPYGSVGELGVSSEVRSLDGMALGQGGVPRLAHFPAENFCGPSAISIERDQELRGLSIQGVLDRLNALSPASLEPGGAVLSLDFSTDTERMCVQLGAPPNASTAVAFTGQVRLGAADENIEGSIDVNFVAEAVDGELVSVSASAGTFTDDPAAAAALASEFAIQEPLDFSGYDGGAFEFSSSESSGEVVGALRAYGLREADCTSQTPVATPGGGMSSPGCAGTERIQLWGFTWGD